MATKYPLSVEGVPLYHQGKVRDTFETRYPHALLVVATDRLSTHNVVHHSLIPGKGKVLTAITIHWCIELLNKLGYPHHVLAWGKDIERYLIPGKYPPDIYLRGIIVEKLDMILVEFIYRAFLAGSLYEKFYKLGKSDPYGLALPEGLPLMTEFSNPIFTPTRKQDGDDPDPPLVADVVRKEHYDAFMFGLTVYTKGRRYMQKRGLDIVDTKFEFGKTKGGVIVIGDEFLTPDSSRFANRDGISAGTMPEWKDKEYFRRIASELWAGRKEEPLVFPEAAVRAGSRIYEELFLEMRAGMPLERFQHLYMV